MKIIPSRHLMNDRVDRYLFIATRLGFGDVIHSVKHEEDTISITTTGVILVTGRKGTLVTLYIATLAQIMQHYGEQEIPQALLRQVRYNEKRNFIVLQDQVKSKGK